MDQDEEQLVVVRRLADRPLQREQLGDVQVRAVGERRGVATRAFQPAAPLLRGATRWTTFPG